MANNKTGSSISKAKLEELRIRAENRRAGSSPTYKASATGSSVSAAKLAELKKKAKTKKPTKQNVPSMLAEMRSKSGQGKATVAKSVKAKKDKPKNQKVPSIIAEMRSKKPTKSSGSTGSSVSATKLAELKKKAKVNSQKPKAEKVPSMIAELRSKKPKKSTTTDRKPTTVVKTAPKKESNVTKASVKSNEVNYNVGVSKGGVSFNKAFAHFRKKGAKTFTWNGKKYTTELAKSGKKSKPKGIAV